MDVSRIICFIFGHSWELLKIGVGKLRVQEKIGNFNHSYAKMYYHWECKRCGLNTCNKRFRRYRKK